MMNNLHEEGQQLGASAGLCGCGEANLTVSSAGTTPIVRSERSTLSEMGKRLGRKALAQVACVAKILAWYRRLVAKKFDGLKVRAISRSAALDQLKL